jgi:hypothetical protein
MPITEAEKDFIYCAFRMKMWGEGRGTYHNIDDDFAAGLLEKEWREYLAKLIDDQQAMDTASDD